MSMQQPIPPEQNVEPTVVDAPTEGIAAPVEPTMEQPVADGAAPVETQEAAPQDQQVIEQVAQGLAEEEITAADIMTAVLSDSLGISPAGAQSLFQLLMTELADDVQEDTAPVDAQANDVPPEAPMM